MGILRAQVRHVRFCLIGRSWSRALHRAQNAAGGAPTLLRPDGRSRSTPGCRCARRAGRAAGRAAGWGKDPARVVPTGYRAELAIGPQLTGHIDITGDVAQPTQLIRLHGRDLDVTSAIATDGATRVVLDAGEVGGLSR